MARVNDRPPALTLSRRKKIAFALATFALAGILGFGGLLALDVYLHSRTQNLAGVNVWGYRGPVIGKKKPGEVRIAVLGGSTAFGYGLPFNESWPYYLEQTVNAERAGHPPVTVVNLGVPADSARAFVATLNDYNYLNFDIVCFYEGYNDLDQDAFGFKAITNPDVPHYLLWRHQSPIFRWTGYFPILPLVLNEKAMAMRYGGNLNAAYGTEKIVFRPNLAVRTTAAAMRTASELGVEIEKKFGTLAGVKPQLTAAVDDSCGRWRQYCGAVVITQPYLSDLHVDQQTALTGMMARRFGGNPRVLHVNLGRTIDIRDTSLVYDGIHLVARGNRLIAEAVAPHLRDLIR
jgi:hypothetical protein